MVWREVLRGPAAAPGGRPRSALRRSEIDLLIAIEGRALAAAIQVVARQFCISQAAARSWIQRLRKSELVRTVAIVDRARCGAAVESVARIRVDLSHAGVADLEAALRDDPVVTQAALTFGPFDYTAFVTHKDFHEAAVWSRWLQSQPCVSWCRVDRMQTRFKRFAFAAALFRAGDRP